MLAKITLRQFIKIEKAIIYFYIENSCYSTASQQFVASLLLAITSPPSDRQNGLKLKAVIADKIIIENVNCKTMEFPSFISMLRYLLHNC